MGNWGYYIRRGSYDIFGLSCIFRIIEYRRFRRYWFVSRMGKKIINHLQDLQGGGKIISRNMLQDCTGVWEKCGYRFTKILPILLFQTSLTVLLLSKFVYFTLLCVLLLLSV